MRNTFERELSQLHDELIKMGNLCETAISLAIQGMLENNDDLIRKVFVVDTEIDQKEREIERMSLHLLLTQQPVASDLRMTSAALKMVSDMERIGDQASDIAEISKQLQDKDIARVPELSDMADAAIGMVTASINSFVKNDLELARKTIQDDDIVDNYFDQIRDHLITLIQEKPHHGAAYIDLLMINKYLERIADHATNIAEWVEYSLTGLYKGDRL